MVCGHNTAQQPHLCNEEFTKAQEVFAQNFAPRYQVGANIDGKHTHEKAFWADLQGPLCK